PHRRVVALAAERVDFFGQALLLPRFEVARQIADVAVALLDRCDQLPRRDRRLRVEWAQRPRQLVAEADDRLQLIVRRAGLAGGVRRFGGGQRIGDLRLRPEADA